MRELREHWFQWRQRYSALPDNDKRALLIMVAAMVLALVYWSLASSHKSQQQAQQFYQKSVQDYLWLVTNDPYIRSLQSQQSAVEMIDGGDSGSLINIATTAAKPFGMDIKRFQPEGEDGLRMWLDGAEFDQLIRWLAMMEQQGLVVEQVDVDRLKGQSGRVDVRVMLLRAAP